MDRNVRIGGPCESCGLPQVARASGCTRTRSECAYGKDPDPEIIQMMTDLAPKPTTPRLARMLRLYIAATEGMTQKRIAQATGVNESTLSRFLSGEKMPDGAAFSALLVWCLGRHEA